MNQRLKRKKARTLKPSSFAAVNVAFSIDDHETGNNMVTTYETNYQK